MGGCATKLQEEDNTVPSPSPAPAPAPVKEESLTVSDANVVVETKEIEEGNQEKEVDEQGNKRRSLGLLLKENEEEKESPENEPAEAIPLEPIKQEPIKQEELKIENATKGSNTSIPETLKSENRGVEAPAPVVVVATETVETEKSTEAAPGVETKKPGNFEEKKADEEKGSSTATKIENATNGSNISIPDTLKSENPGVEVPSPVVAVATETVETEKSTEAAPGVETKNSGNFEEKKAEEEKGSAPATKIENATKGSNTSIPETLKSENPVVEAPASVVAVATETVKTEKSIEAAPGVETKKPGNFEEKKAEEEKGSATATKDVKVIGEATKDSSRQDEPVLLVSSAEKVAGEVAETK